MTDTASTPEIFVIDTRGQVCPSTLLVTLQHLNEQRDMIRRGDRLLRVMTDNRHATATIPGTARSMGYEVSVTREASYYVIDISKAVPPGRTP